MKKILVVMLCAVSLFVVPCGAVGADLLGDTLSDPVPTSEAVELVDERMELAETSVYSLSPITSDNTTGLTSLVLSLIGNYDPVVVEYRYQNSTSSNWQYLREVQPDYPWLVSAGIFAIVLFCALRIMGGAICKK